MLRVALHQGLLSSKLGRRFLFWVLIFSSIFTLSVTAVQLYVSYEREKKDLELEFKEAMTLFKAPLETSAWNFYDDLLISQMQSILSMRSVARVTLTLPDRPPLLAEGLLSPNGPLRRFSLYRPDHPNEPPIGEVKIEYSLDPARSTVLSQLALLLALNLLRTLFVSVVILGLFSLLVSYRILVLAGMTKGLYNSQAIKVGDLVEVPKKSGDELQYLGECIETMHRNFERSFEKLQQSEARLLEILEFGSDVILETDAKLKFRFIRSKLDDSDPLSRFLKIGASLTSLPLSVSLVPKIMAHQPVQEGHFEIVMADGTKQLYRISLKPSYNGRNLWTGYRGKLLNVTARLKHDMDFELKSHLRQV